MSRLIEVNQDGNLEVPGDIVGAAPHQRYIVERQGSTLVLRPESLTPAERWLEWVDSHVDDGTPALPEWAITREGVYD